MEQKDLSGMRFGKLLVVGRYGGPCSAFKMRWECICECGEVRFIRTVSITSGNSKSCGCVRKSSWKRVITKHGLTNHPLYSTWREMKKRCTNPKHKAFSNYGGRGILVCERWMSLNNFVEDMGAKPSPIHELDRENNDGNYEPGNCRWVTKSVQSRNKRTNHRIEFLGKTKCLADWSRDLGIGRGAISYRLSKGDSFSQIVASMQGVGA